MNRRNELRRHGVIAALALPAAAVVWFAFHAVYADLNASEQAVGYVDPTTQSGIYFGYLVMLGAVVLLAAVGLWSAVKCLVLLLGRRS